MIPAGFKPMLSATCDDITKLTYPVLASPKLDGIRCIILDGVPYTRTMKPIPNDHVRKLLTGLPDLDGELIVGSPTGDDVINRTTKGIMKKTGAPEFTYWVFDCPTDGRVFSKRLGRTYYDQVELPNFCRIVEHELIGNTEVLDGFERKCVELGYEGIMVRDPEGRYKHGRSTLRDRGLAKVKRWQDDEFEIVGYEEEQHNGNEATKDAFGKTKRSTHKANKTGTGTLGALLCNTKDGVEFSVIGLSKAERAELWADRVNLPGRYAKVKYFGFTPDGKPRFPGLLGLRHADDMEKAA